jgi:hypothetical protein
MIGPARYVPRVVWVAALLAGVCLTGRAEAVEVSIQVDSEERLELARRLLSELESEGYKAQIAADAGPSSAPSPCDEGGTRPMTVPSDAKAWIRLSAGPPGDPTVVASICYLGALPFLQQAAPSAPSSEPQTLAVATAEALNGLRSRLPPVVGEAPEPVRPKDRPTPPARPEPASRTMNDIAIGAALLVALPDYPAAPGAVLRSTLGITSWAALTIDAFMPTRGAELESAQVTATVRMAWLRVGPRIGGELGDFDLSGALLAGPALAWAGAVARAPRVGTADVSSGAIFSLAAFAEYPNDTRLFASAAASASALLPGSRVSLGSSTSAPRGFFPVEASFGLGLRWGE